MRLLAPIFVTSYNPLKVCGRAGALAQWVEGKTAGGGAERAARSEIEALGGATS